MLRIGFDNEKYLRLQSEKIRERIARFGGKLYLEFGGKLFDDYHASRVLPGFQPDSKIRMLQQLRDDVEIVIAVCANDIEKNKLRGDLGISYDDDCLRLMDAYALRLTWWLGWRMALLLVGYAVCAWALAQAFMGFVAPVYTFPEWVPKVLVEPADISAAFWNVWQSQAAVRELRTPELLRLRFMREVCAWATGALALWLGMLWGRLSHSVYELARRRLA